MAAAETLASFFGAAPADTTTTSTATRRSIPAEDSPSAQHNHLKWLTAADQRDVARGDCASALREEEKVLKDIRGVVRQYRKATEHCRVAVENDPTWFADDVQDCHARRIALLEKTLAALDADPLPHPAGYQALDGIRSRVSVSLAHAAQATSNVAAGIEEVTTQVAEDFKEATTQVQESLADRRVGEQLQSAAQAARTAFSNMTIALSDTFGVADVDDFAYGSSVGSAVAPAARLGVACRQPVELLHVQRHGCSAYRSAVAEMQGWRLSHEDSHAMVCSAGSGSFWVLDGHGGEAAALYGAPELARVFAPSTNSSAALPDDDVIRQGFEDVDQRFRDRVTANTAKMSGSTVIGAMIELQENGRYNVKFANCGDSRAVVCTPIGAQEADGCPGVKTSTPEYLMAQDYEDPTWPVVLETIDHKPDHPVEKARVEAAGGMVTNQTPPRIDGILAVSRALGDFDFKKSFSLPPPQQRVSCEPDLYQACGLPPGTLIVLACDGIWDVMSSAAVANFVVDQLTKNSQADLGNVAAALVRLCMQRSSFDNMTAMIIRLEDGLDWKHSPDEVMDFEAFACGLIASPDCKYQHELFLKRSGFPAAPAPCDFCRRWLRPSAHCSGSSSESGSSSSGGGDVGWQCPCQGAASKAFAAVAAQPEATESKADPKPAAEENAAPSSAAPAAETAAVSELLSEEMASQSGSQDGS